MSLLWALGGWSRVGDFGGSRSSGTVSLSGKQADLLKPLRLMVNALLRR
jgi:hypothetical protein